MFLPIHAAPPTAAEVAPAEAAGAPAGRVEGRDDTPRRHDPLFPGGGRLSTSLATGVPFVAIGELAVGIGDRVTLGALGGATPDVPGFGVRPRVSAVEIGRFRAVIAAPSLYYPATGEGGPPWLLTRPSIVLEHAWSSGVRFGAGVGLVAAASTHRLAGGSRRLESYGGKPIESGVWNTVNVTFSAPVGANTSVFTEGALVIRGVRLAGDEWVGVVPFTLSAGVTTNLF